MGKEQVNVLILLLFLSLCSASDQKWRKALMSAQKGSSLVMNRVGSSFLFPVDGNVYPRGYYNVTINVGHPPKPYFLDIDTGSDLTWLQCDFPCRQCIEAPHPLYQPSNDFVAYEDPLCAALHPPGDYKCEHPKQCHYKVEYADGSSRGVLLRDVFSLNYTNGVRISPRLALGCGYKQRQGEFYHPLDGILGLGRGKVSILSQLQSQDLVRNIVGHCLSGRGGGFLFFGEGLYDFPRVTWTPMSQEFTDYYSPGIAELRFGGKATGLKDLIVVFDSGSSYTYLNSEAYQRLEDLLNKELSGRSLKEDKDDKTLSLCWKGRKPFRTVRDVKKYFKNLAFAFTSSGGTNTQYELQPEAYLIISNKGNVCLGILNGTQIGLGDLNVIGDISMQDRMVIYDNENQGIGWTPANCDELPRSKTANM